jgi:hypothetical protein
VRRHGAGEVGGAEGERGKERGRGTAGGGIKNKE